MGPRHRPGTPPKGERPASPKDQHLVQSTPCQSPRQTDAGTSQAGRNFNYKREHTTRNSQLLSHGHKFYNYRRDGPGAWAWPTVHQADITMKHQRNKTQKLSLTVVVISRRPLRPGTGHKHAEFDQCYRKPKQELALRHNKQSCHLQCQQPARALSPLTAWERQQEMAVALSGSHWENGLAAALACS